MCPVSHSAWQIGLSKYLWFEGENKDSGPHYLLWVPVLQPLKGHQMNSKRICTSGDIDPCPTNAEIHGFSRAVCRSTRTHLWLEFDARLWDSMAEMNDTEEAFSGLNLMCCIGDCVYFLLVMLLPWNPAQWERKLCLPPLTLYRHCHRSHEVLSTSPLQPTSPSSLPLRSFSTPHQFHWQNLTWNPYFTLNDLQQQQPKKAQTECW